ncbi:MAG: hypothetical protein ABSD13_20485, partial [Candidatus Korobacteraceae bacterium]
CVAADPSSAAFLLHLCLTHTALTANRKNEIPSRVFQQSHVSLERMKAATSPLGVSPSRANCNDAKIEFPIKNIDWLGHSDSRITVRGPMSIA